MREQTEIVNVAARRQRMAERVGTNGQLSQILDTPEVPHSHTDGLWQRFKNSILPPTEVLNVNGRTVSGFVVPHWAAGVILAAIIGGGAALYRTVTTEQQSQRDMLIEMKTELKLSKEHDAEYRGDTKRTMELQQVYINDISKQLVAIKAVLTPSQVRLLQSKRQEN